jgi:predicted ATPase/DNA-binding SARP family transcriptional activator
MLEVHLLGRFEILLDGQPLDLPSRPAQSLLAYLVLHPGVPHRREQLAGLLWPDSGETNARRYLSQALWLLRKGLDDTYFKAEKLTLTFTPQPDDRLDVHILTQPATIVPDAWMRSLAVYQGRLLPGFYEDWAWEQAEHFQALFEQQAHTLLDWLVTEHRWNDVLEWGEHWLRLGETPEPAYRALMQAYAGLGDQAGVATVYHRCVTALDRDLGVEPSPETTTLYEQLRTGELQMQRPAQSMAHPHNLPVEPTPTPFIGREKELGDLTAWLGQDKGRLLTIVGPGGMGKTRLAMACAAQVLGESNGIPSAFPHGLYFVNLAPLSDAAHIVPTLADAMHFPLQGGERDQRSPKQQVLDYLREKRMLLVLDNFEHLLEEAHLVADILQTAAQVKILVTSRERLHLRQEQVFPIQGLEFPETILQQESEYPEEPYAAVKLFIQAAQRTRPDFHLNGSDDLTYLARICHLVDGMPLALELAAAWVDTLPLAKIATEIQASLDFLESEMRDAPARHHSIRATIDCSWQKLTFAEQTIFAQLSVFRGGFTRQAGQTITGASLPLLARLVNKSFLQYYPARDRYQVHELMRQFGAEQLATDQERETAISNQHSTYYCQSLAARAVDLKGSRQKEVITEIEADVENTRAAWNSAVRQRDFAWLEQAAFSLTRFYEWKGRFQEYEEVVAAAIGALTQSQASPNQQAVLAHLLHLQCARPNATIPERRGFLEQTLALLAHLAQTETDVTALQADDEFHRGLLYGTVGDYPQAERALQNGLTYYQQSGKKWEAVGAWLGLGSCATLQGNYPQAEAHAQQALALARSIGDRLSIAMALTSLSYIANNQGQFALSRRFAEESLEIAQELGQLWMQGRMLMEIGTSFTAEVRQTEALPYHQESLAVLRQMGDRQNMAHTMVMLAWDNMGLEDLETAEHWLQEANELARKIQDRRTLAYCLITRCCLALLMGRYDEALIHGQEAATMARGASVGVDLLAVVYVYLGWTQLVHERLIEAEKSFYEALTMRNVFSYDAFLPIAYLLGQRSPTPDRVQQAWQLIGLYERSALLGKSGLLKPLAERIQPPELLNLPTEEIEVAKAHGRTLDPDTVIAELIEELPKLGWGEG